jgi:hypothetical protein
MDAAFAGEGRFGASIFRARRSNRLLTASGIIPATTTNGTSSEQRRIESGARLIHDDASERWHIGHDVSPHTTDTHAASAGASRASTVSGSGSGFAQAQLLKQLIAHLQQMLAKLEAQIAVAAAYRGPAGLPKPELGGLRAEASVIQG